MRWIKTLITKSKQFRRRLLTTARSARESELSPVAPLFAEEASQTTRRRDLVGEDLEGRDLRHTDLRGADLRGADLLGTQLDGADLRGARFDMTRLVEIAVPDDLPLDLVNQIRHFDFRSAMARLVPAHPPADCPCPYQGASLRPLLYEWGSRTWRGGRDWRPPEVAWTLEEIIATVLDELGCRHDLTRPLRNGGRGVRLSGSANMRAGVSE